MTTANTDSRYGSIQKSSHGLTAVLILIPMGLIANALPRDTSEPLAQPVFVFSMRKTTGIAPFFVAPGRIGKWGLTVLIFPHAHPRVFRPILFEDLLTFGNHPGPARPARDPPITLKSLKKYFY